MAKKAVSAAKRVARKVGISPQAVNKRLRKGETPEQIIAEKTGRKPKGQSEGETRAEAERREAIAKANLREMEVRQKRGELIPLEAASMAWSQLVQVTKTSLLSMPNAVCEQLQAMTDAGEIRQFLTAEIDKRLRSLADDFRNTAQSALDSGESSDSAASPDEGV